MSSAADQEPTTSAEKPTLESIFTSTESTDPLSAEISDGPSKTQHAKNIGTTTPEVEGEEQEPVAAVEEYPTTPVSPIGTKPDSPLRLSEISETPLLSQPEEIDGVEDLRKGAKETSSLENEQLDTAQEPQLEVTVPSTEVQGEVQQPAAEVRKPAEAITVDSEPLDAEKTSKPILTKDDTPFDDVKLEQAEDKVPGEDDIPLKEDGEPSAPDALEKVEYQITILDDEKPKAAPELKTEVLGPATVEDQNPSEGEKPSSEVLDGTAELVPEDIEVLVLGDKPEEVLKVLVDEGLGTEKPNKEEVESKHDDTASNEISEELAEAQPFENELETKVETEVAEPEEKKEVGEVPATLETAANFPEPTRSEQQQVDTTEPVRQVTEDVLPGSGEDKVEETQTTISVSETIGLSEPAKAIEDEPAVAETSETVAQTEVEPMESVRPVVINVEVIPVVEETSAIEEEKPTVEGEEELEVAVGPEIVNTEEKTVTAGDESAVGGNVVAKGILGLNSEVSGEEAKAINTGFITVEESPAKSVAAEETQISKKIPEIDETSIVKEALGVQILTVEETPAAKEALEVEGTSVVQEAKVTEESLAGDVSLVEVSAVEESLVGEETMQADRTLTDEKEPIPEEVSAEEVLVAEGKTAVDEELPVEDPQTVEKVLIVDQESTTEEALEVEAVIIEEVSVIEVLPAVEEETEDELKQSEPMEESVLSSDLKEAVVELAFDSSATGKIEVPPIGEPQAEKADDVEIIGALITSEETTAIASVEDKEVESFDALKEMESIEIVKGGAVEGIETIAEGSSEKITSEQSLVVEPTTVAEEPAVEEKETHELKAESPIGDLAAVAETLAVEGELKSGEVSQPVEEALVIGEELVIEEEPAVGDVFAVEVTSTLSDDLLVEESRAREEVPIAEQESIPEEAPTTEEITTIEEKPVEEATVQAVDEFTLTEQKYAKERTPVEETKPLEPKEEATEEPEIEKGSVGVQEADVPEAEVPSGFEIREEAQEETVKVSFGESEIKIKIVENVVEPETAPEMQGSGKFVEPEGSAREPENEDAPASEVLAEGVEVALEEHVEVPEIVVELTTENQPSYGDDLGPDATLGQQEAFEKRKEDAKPDKTVVVEEPSTTEAASIGEATEPTGADSGNQIVVENQHVKLPGEVSEKKDEGLAGNEENIEETPVKETSALDEDEAVVISHDDARPEDVAEAEAAVQVSDLVEIEKLEDVSATIGLEADAETTKPSKPSGNGEEVVSEVLAETRSKVLDAEEPEEKPSTTAQEEVKDEAVSNQGITEDLAQEVFISPLLASETFGNPINIAPGEKVPNLGASSIGSNVKLDEESYGRADGSNLGILPEAKPEEQVISINPLPSPETAMNPLDLQTGESIPETGTASAKSVVRLNVESYEKADASSLGVETEDVIRQQPEEFSVRLLPASETTTNPISLMPDEPVPKIGSASMESNIKLDEESYGRPDASNLGVGPREEVEEQVFSVSPLPASEAAANPIDLQPGEPVPVIGSASTESNVKLDEESYEKADASNFGVKPLTAVEVLPEVQVSIDPFPASQTVDNPIGLQPGEPIPRDQLNAGAIDANVELDEESYKQADTSNLGVPLSSNTYVHPVIENVEAVREPAVTAELLPGVFGDGVGGVAKGADADGIAESAEEPTAPEVDAYSTAAEDTSKSLDVIAEEYVEGTIKDELEEPPASAEIKIEPGLFADKSTGEITASTGSDSAIPTIAASVLGGTDVVGGAAAIIAHSSNDKLSSENVGHNIKSPEDVEEPTGSKQADEELITEPAPQTAPSLVHGIVIPEADVKQVVEDSSALEAPAIVVTSPTTETSQEIEERTVEVIEPTPGVEGSTLKAVERESENTSDGVRRRRLAGPTPGSRPVSSGNDTVSTKQQKNVMHAFWKVLFFGWLGGFGRIFTGIFGKSKKAQRAN